MSAHPNCNDGHVCQDYSGQPCIEPDCMEDAGTLWGPLWCPDHDRERLNGIDANLRAALDHVEATP